MVSRSRFNILGQAHFVTFGTWQGQWVFNRDELFHVIIENLDFYRRKFRFKLLAFAVLPWHVHLLIMLDEKFNDISRVMRDLKKFTAVQIIQQLIKDKEDDLLAQLSYSGQVEIYRPTLGKSRLQVGSEDPTEPFGQVVPIDQVFHTMNLHKSSDLQNGIESEGPTAPDGRDISISRAHPFRVVRRSSDRCKGLKYHVWQPDFLRF